MDDTATRPCGWWSGPVAAALLTGLALFVAACGGLGAGSIGEDDVVIDDSNGGTNGGGLQWPPLPEGPDIPQQDEIDIYAVLAAADAPRCADLFTTGVTVQFETRTAEARFAASPPGDFGTGSRTYHLYRAAAHLCAGEGLNARSAFADALSEAPWSEPLGESAGEADLQRVVCHVWDAVTALLGPGAGPCTLTVPSPEDPDEEADEDAPVSLRGADALAAGPW